MLHWTRDDDGWRSNGYLIELVAPHHWELRDATNADGPVLVERQPLATARTLTRCKREAELLEIAGRIAEVRKRHWGLLVLSLVGFMFVPSFAPPSDLVAVLVLLATTTRAIGYLAGSYMAGSHVSVDDLFYQ